MAEKLLWLSRNTSNMEGVQEELLVCLRARNEGEEGNERERREGGREERR